MNDPEFSMPHAFGLSALLEAGRTLDEPSPHDRERVRARLAVTLTTAATLTTPTTPTPPTALEPVRASAAHGGNALSKAGAGVTAHTGVAWTVIGHGLLLAMVAATSAAGVMIWSRHSHGHTSVARVERHAALAAPAHPVAESAEVAPAPHSEQASDAVLSASPEGSMRAVAVAGAGAVKSGSSDAQPRHKHTKHRAKATEAHPEREPPVSAEPTGDPEPAVPPPSAAEPDALVKSAAPASAGPAGASGLGAELALLVAAQRALAASDLSRALALLDQHAQRYPEGSLVPERLAARAAALCRLHRADEGARELRSLRQRAPSSPLLSWAVAYCRHDSSR